MIVEVRHAAEDRDVLGRLVARAVAGGQPRQRADDLDVEVLLGDRQADEVVGAARGEHRIGRRERHEALARQARRRRSSAAARPCPSGRSGRDSALAKMCRSVYFARSAVSPTISGRFAGLRDQRVAERRGLGALPGCRERGDHRRGGEPLLRLLHAAFARSGSRAAWSWRSCRPPLLERRLAGGIEHRHRLVPFVGVDPQEMGHLALLEERHALGHLGVADDDPRPRLLSRRAPGRRPRPARRCRCRRPAGCASRRPPTSPRAARSP